MFDYDSAAVWPNSSVTEFICTKPSPANYSKCKASNNLQKTVEVTISVFSGLRRCKTIGEEVESDFKWLQNDGCDIINEIVEDMSKSQSTEIERKFAEIIIDNLTGFGPKQSRNLLQGLGLAKFEIPVYCRITK